MASIGAIIIAPIVLTILAILTTSTRFYVKRTILRKITWDDWFILISTVLLITVCALTFVRASKGDGKHEYELPRENILQIYELYFFSELLYTICTATVKISIGLMMLRICRRETHRVAWWLITYTMSYYTLTTIIAVPIVIFQCTPVDKYWDHAKPGSCFSRTVFNGLTYTFTVGSTMSDLTFALVPCWLVWNARMDRRTKISICIVLSLGLSSCIVTIARFWYIPDLALPYDSTYNGVIIAELSVVEVGLGIIAGNLATFRPLLRRLANILSSYRSSRSKCSDPATSLQSPPQQSNSKTPGQQVSQIGGRSDVEIGVPKPYEATAAEKEVASKEWNEMLVAITARRKSTSIPPSTSYSPHVSHATSTQRSNYSYTSNGKLKHVSENIPLPSFISHEGESADEYDEHEDLSTMTAYAADFAKWNQEDVEATAGLEMATRERKGSARKDSEVWGNGNLPP